jgi:Eukaryotic aspartyl protease
MRVSFACGFVTRSAGGIRMVRSISLTSLVAAISVGCDPGPCPLESLDGGASSMAADTAEGSVGESIGSPITVPLTGCGGPGYAASFAIGSQTFELSVDTGSSTLAVASTLCSNCDVSPSYAPGPKATDDKEQISQTYAIGSWDADIYTDSVQLSGGPAAVTMDFGAIETQTGFFVGGGCGLGSVAYAPQGIVGFGPPDLAIMGTDSFLSKYFASGTMRRLFAAEFCPMGGQLMVGGMDAVRGAVNGPTVYTPMANSRYYGVALDDVALGGATLGFGPSDFGVAAVDTGSSVLALPSHVYQALASKLANDGAFMSAFGGKTSWLGTTTCVPSSMTREELDAQLPQLTLTFPKVGGGTIALARTATQSYLAPTSSNETEYYCSGIYENPTATGTILGTAAMLGEMVIFDLDNLQIGFAPQTYCR